VLTESVQANSYDRPAVEKLIRQLGDRDFARRQAASRELRHQGEAVLPALLQARNHCDAETGRRLDELIGPMQTARFLHPRRVTLPDRASLKQYLALLGAQSGYTIQADASEGLSKLELPCARAPFWPTLDRICDATGCGFIPEGQSEAIRLVSQRHESPYRCYDGIFRVTAQGFRHTRSMHFAQVPRQSQLLNQVSDMLTLDLLVQVEPRTSLLRIGRPRVQLAVDEQDRSMAPPDSGRGAEPGLIYYGSGMGRGRMQQVATQLLMPSKDSTLVRRIKGVIPATILAEQKPVLLTDKVLKAQGKKLKVGNATFTVNQVEVGKGSQKTYRILLGYDEETTGQHYDYSRIQMISQRLELRDSRGGKINANAGLTQLNSPTSAQFQLSTMPGASREEPARLIFLDWVQLEHEIAFDLKNLPLP
jgi:hypothetical protein